MMGFNFDDVVGAGKGGSLQGNTIHSVKFDGCEASTVDTKNGQSKVLDIKFSNNEGVFTHRVFEPVRSEDFEDREMGWGKTPSNVKTMMLLFKHLIDAVNPELGKEIDEKKKSLATTSWDSLCKLVVDSTNPGVGKETKIKLVKNKNGYAAFPYFAIYDKNGKLNYRTKFIGDNVMWQAWELDKISKEDNAKPTSADNLNFGEADKKEDPINFDF